MAEVPENYHESLFINLSLNIIPIVCPQGTITTIVLPPYNQTWLPLTRTGQPSIYFGQSFIYHHKNHPDVGHLNLVLQTKELIHPRTQAPISLDLPMAV
jgi:hypothetical protein